MSSEPQTIDFQFVFFLNILLTNNEFLTIKRIFKTDFWRFDIAVFKFKKKNLAYGLFPIRWNENKKQIIRFKTEPANFGDYPFRCNFLKTYGGSTQLLNRLNSTSKAEILGCHIIRF